VCFASVTEIGKLAERKACQETYLPPSGCQIKLSFSLPYYTNYNYFAVLRDLNPVDITSVISHEISDVCSGLYLTGNLFLVF
jgi:hypothetical protein